MGSSGVKKAVLDAGPFIHLEQVESLHVLDLLDEKIVSQTVKSEIGSETFGNIEAEIRNLEGEGKDKAKYLTNRYGIELGEATALVLCQQLNEDLFLTDDLDARDVANKLDLEPHGTLGIVTRAYSEDLISEQEAKVMVRELQDESSLFITSDLVEWAKDKIESF